MVAQPCGAMASAPASVQPTISHEGVGNMVINQECVNQLMYGAQVIETAVGGVNEGTGIEAIKTVMRVTAMVIRVLVRLRVDVSARIGDFEAIEEIEIQLLQGQSQETFEAAKKGYELITTKIDKQSIEMARVLTNASESSDKMKQEMGAIKVTSRGELQAMKDAITKMESKIIHNAASNAGGWLVGNGFNKSAMEHKAISNLKSLGNDRQGYRQWHH